MRDKLKKWIAEGRIEEVLDELIPLTDEAIVVKSNYINVKKRFNLNLVESKDLLQAQAKATESALYLINKHFPNSTDGGFPQPMPEQPTLTKPTKKVGVFISYNHGDSKYADQVQALLEAEGFDVKRDKDDMEVGEVIQDFIDRMIKSKGFVLSIISKNSLSSGWVGIESNLAGYALYFGVSRFIPVMVDDALFNDYLVFDVVEDLDNKIKQIDESIEKSKKLGIAYDQFETKRKRFQDLRFQLPQIINKLQGMLVVNVADQNWDAGMQKVLQTLKSGT